MIDCGARGRGFLPGLGVCDTGFILSVGKPYFFKYNGFYKRALVNLCDNSKGYGHYKFIYKAL